MAVIPPVIVDTPVIARNSQLPSPTSDTLAMLTFQKLDVYQAAIQFVVLSFKIIRSLPKGNADLADQLRRSARSTPQNIAEGAGRASRPDKAKHYVIARAEAMESASTLDVMKVEEIVDPVLYAHGIELLERIVSMLTKML